MVRAFAGTRRGGREERQRLSPDLANHLRQQIDLALAAYLLEHREAMPSRVGVLELIGWLSDIEMNGAFPPEAGNSPQT
jgi:hypothetical protein